MTASAGLIRFNVEEADMTVMLSLAVGWYVAGWCATVRRGIVAGNTAARVGHWINDVAVGTGRSNPAIGSTFEVSTVAG
jgi:hypothetical protein